MTALNKRAICAIVLGLITTSTTAQSDPGDVPAQAIVEGDNPPGGVHCYDIQGSAANCSDNPLFAETAGVGPWNCDVVKSQQPGEGYICDSTYTYWTYCYPGSVPFAAGNIKECQPGCCAATWGVEQDGTIVEIGSDGDCVRDIDQGCGPPPGEGDS